jgi:hypothetical protein
MKPIVVLAIILNLSLTSAIYDATFAEHHQFPFSVLVKRLNKFCTGAIISDRHVVTAGVCVCVTFDLSFRHSKISRNLQLTA